MSGFLGVYRPDGAAFDERLLNGILQRLRFRGPDAQNIFVERDFASGFSFLETVPQDWREKPQNPMRAQYLFTLSMTAELFRILDFLKITHRNASGQRSNHFLSGLRRCGAARLR
jgi:hypothetical protein